MCQHNFRGGEFNLCDKDFAERSGELSGAICLFSKPLLYWVMTGTPLELFRKFFGAVRAIFWLCGSFLAPKLRIGFTKFPHPESDGKSADVGVGVDLGSSPTSPAQTPSQTAPA